MNEKPKTIVGLMIHVPKDSTPALVILETLADGFFAMGKILHIQYPCGGVAVFDKDHFPQHSVPCWCMKPDHWLIKVEYEK